MCKSISVFPLRGVVHNPLGRVAVSVLCAVMLISCKAQEVIDDIQAKSAKALETFTSEPEPEKTQTPAPAAVPAAEQATTPVQKVNTLQSKWKGHSLLYQNDTVEVYTKGQPDSFSVKFAAIHKIGTDAEIFPLLNAGTQADQNVIWEQFKTLILSNEPIAKDLSGKIQLYHYVQTGTGDFPPQIGAGKPVTRYQFVKVAVDGTPTNRWSWHIDPPMDGINTFNKRMNQN